MTVVHEPQSPPVPPPVLDEDHLAELIYLSLVPGTRSLVDPETVTAEQMLAVMLAWQARCGCDAARLDAWVYTHSPDAMLAARMLRCRAAAHRLWSDGWAP